MRFLRALRRFFAGPSVEGVKPGVFPRQTMAWHQAMLLVRLYYVALAYLAISILPYWDGWLHAASFDPLWPVAWLRWTGSETQTGILATLALYLFGSIAAALWPQARWARVLAWLGIFEFVAFSNSFGKIGHSLHGMVLTGFVLIFLPRLREGILPQRVRRQCYLQVFWLTQAIFLLVYSMAGLGKVLGCLYQAALGQMTVLNPHAFAYQVAARLVQTDMHSVLGAWLIDHYWVGWPFYVGMVYIQFFSLWAAFRPRLLRPWGLALILFHVGSYFIFTILFTPNILLIGFFLLAAPAARLWDFGPRFWESLPLIGFLWRRLARLATGAPCA